ncbi:LicD family protein [Pediococcus acidilactici]|uniref:LicD family protein n=1 Tax=Pediococcus acidilactici TaxID=1254 RepID=UPI001BD1D411|nr:LicD family protein [Pediococcus acidilactici]MBS9398424.1 LicD family protein [Pediococcus acidilactici]
MDKELRKLQLIDIDILNNVVDVLEENNLKYFLIAGTLLGAVRHKGFIPWDDDMDIAMPREDYDKFLEVFAKRLPPYLHVKNFMTDSTFKYYITRIVDERYKVRELRNNNRTESITNVSIDIFPIDGVPDNKIMRKFYYFRVLSYRALISLIQKENIDTARKRNFFEKIVISLGTKLPLKKFFDANKLQFKIDKLLKKQSNNSFYAGTIMGAYRTKEILPREYFGKGRTYEFEGRKFIGPTKYKEYLRHMYGDYMKLPSKKDQESKRHFEII